MWLYFLFHFPLSIPFYGGGITNLTEQILHACYISNLSNYILVTWNKMLFEKAMFKRYTLTFHRTTHLLFVVKTGQKKVGNLEGLLSEMGIFLYTSNHNHWEVYSYLIIKIRNFSNMCSMACFYSDNSCRLWNLFLVIAFLQTLSVTCRGESSW